MRVSELIDILDHYDPDDDVIVSAQPDSYFQFIVTKHSGQSIIEGKSYVVALEPTDQIRGYNCNIR
jgi:hypothetical protein